MITEENDPQMQKALQQLLFRLRLFAGLPLTKTRLDEMFEIVKEHRKKWRLEGVDFPVLAALVVPRLGIIDWVRADLDAHSIATKIVNFMREYQDWGITMPEVVNAFSAAFNNLHPDDISQNIKRVTEEFKKKEERRLLQ